MEKNKSIDTCMHVLWKCILNVCYMRFLLESPTISILTPSPSPNWTYPKEKKTDECSKFSSRYMFFLNSYLNIVLFYL